MKIDNIVWEKTKEIDNWLSDMAEIIQFGSITFSFRNGNSIMLELKQTHQLGEKN